ncbi:MAG: filamentous hemagglutinin N-terminal domain-containing protein, partial [Rhodoferax sp.]
VWNKALGAMVAVAEISSGQGKSSGASVRSRSRLQGPPRPELSLGTLSIGVALAWGALVPSTFANPVGGSAVVGQASTSTQGKQLTVTTPNGATGNYSAINWQSFNIATGETTFFQQPNAVSLSINRVVSNTPSQIFGTLGSNGRLVLVNQSGITVGAGAVVDTAAFTASALQMSDADLLAGRLRFGDASVPGGALSVQGRVLARNGDALLLGSQVEVGKDALVQAPNGNTLLAAGQQIEITGPGLEGIVLQVQAPANAARNLGTLQGDAVGIFAGTLKHSGLIQAQGVSVEGGKVVLKALDTTSIDGQISARQASGAGGSVEGRAGNAVELLAGASIDVNATQSGSGGKVALIADLDNSNSVARIDGSISARGGDQGGNGGFVETSGAHVKIADTARVNTSAAMGLSGTWLLDPTDFTIAATGGDISGTALSANLGTSDVTIDSNSGQSGTAGIVNVNDAVTWVSNSKLTLHASKSIYINANISGGIPSASSASLALEYGQGTSTGETN